MEYKNQVDGDEDDEDEIEIPSSTSLGFNPPPPSVRGSAFSKPILSPSSSLISPRGGGSGSGTSAAKNVNLFGSTTPSPETTTGAAAGDNSYQSAARSSDPAAVGGATAPTNSKAATGPAAKNSTFAASTNVSIRYRECLRNHAAAIGGHVLDGCGEFMPEGGASTPEALKCAACGCHRSFHRKEADGDAEGGDSYYRGAVRLPLLLPPPPQPQAHHQKQFQFGTPTTPSPGAVAFGGNASGSGGTTTESSSEERINAGVPTPATAQRKRFRTKFTAEQKDRMLAFAERVGWRIQKQDEALVEQFCNEVGVRRQVLKIWMHNNKHLIRKPQQPAQQQDELPHSSQH